MQLDRSAAVAEVQSQAELFDRFARRLPKDLVLQRALLEARVARFPAAWRPGRRPQALARGPKGDGTATHRPHPSA